MLVKMVNVLLIRNKHYDSNAASKKTSKTRHSAGHKTYDTFFTISFVHSCYLNHFTICLELVTIES